MGGRDFVQLNHQSNYGLFDHNENPSKNKIIWRLVCVMCRRRWFRFNISEFEVCCAGAQLTVPSERHRGPPRSDISQCGGHWRKSVHHCKFDDGEEPRDSFLDGDQELPGGPDQWCPLLEIAYHYDVGVVFLRGSAEKLVHAILATHVAPVQRDSITRFTWCVCAKNRRINQLCHRRWPRHSSTCGAMARADKLRQPPAMAYGARLDDIPCSVSVFL